MTSGFKKISEKRIYQNNWITLDEHSVIRPGGSESIFGIVSMQDGVSVLAIDKEMCFYSVEYKYAIQESSIELFSGGIDDGEDPIDCAKRELKEELGACAKHWHYLGFIDPFTTIVNSKNHLFVATELMHGEQSLDEGEVVEIKSCSKDEMLNLALDNKVTHGASTVLILKAKLLGYL